MNFNDFEKIEFEFSGKKATVIFAEKSVRTDKWVLKTEYLEAFPETEIEFLKNGYNVVFLENKTRWGSEEDYRRKYELSRYLVKEYGFFPKCAIIGLSCGGLIGVNLAARFPEMISVLYVDAPVLNLLSCPGYMASPAPTEEGGKAFWNEFYEHKGISRSELLTYRDHPMDRIPVLLENNIPVLLIAGDSDTVVPYNENGIVLEKMYKENGGTIKVIIKEGCDHHPHGLSDPKIIVDFVKKYY